MMFDDDVDYFAIIIIMMITFIGDWNRPIITIITICRGSGRGCCVLHMVSAACRESTMLIRPGETWPGTPWTLKMG